jgi:GWxTD domain-containing protein
MKGFGRWHLIVLVSAGLAVPVLHSETRQDSQQSQQQQNQNSDDKAPKALPKPADQKMTREQMKKAYKELETPYKKWLDEEVVYIISPEERQAFLQLTTNEDRENFIEQFWLRRDPTPDTPENEFKEEHYRRIAYANQYFSSGFPGWKSDRGRIYIIWGPPDSKDSHPAGGPYTRTPEEGGGETTTYPFEDWHYNYLEGVGENIDLEFVDPTGSGEYHLTTDPCEKDALAHVPSGGESDMEITGEATQAQRFTNPNGTTCPISEIQPAEWADPFLRIEQFAKVQQAPPVKFKDLSALVSARIVRNQINFLYHFDFFKVTSDSVMVPVTIQIQNRQMTFKEKDDVHSATVNVFLRVSTIGGKIVQTQEDTISRDFPDTLFQQYLTKDSIYQKTFALRPGLYRLDAVIKDVDSGNVGVENLRLAVPPYNDDEIQGSTLVLAHDIEHIPAKQVGVGQFVIGDSKVTPDLKAEFFGNQKMGVYLQVYNLKTDEKSHKSQVSIEYRVTHGDQEVFKETETGDKLKETGAELTIERMISLDGMQPGKYKIQITVKDQLANQSISRDGEFTVKPVAQERASTGN